MFAIVNCVKGFSAIITLRMTGTYYAVRRFLFYSGSQSWSARRRNLVTPYLLQFRTSLFSRVPCSDKTPQSESHSVILLPRSIGSRRRSMCKARSCLLTSRFLKSLVVSSSLKSRVLPVLMLRSSKSTIHDVTSTRPCPPFGLGVVTLRLAVSRRERAFHTRRSKRANLTSLSDATHRTFYPSIRNLAGFDNARSK